MANLVAVDNKNHKHIKINNTLAETHGKNLHLIPAIVAEFTNLAVQYPILLTKNGDTGQFVCAAMLGFESGENLFWQNEQWQGIYLPLQIQRQPFFISTTPVKNTTQETENTEHLVCIDLDSPTISTSDGEFLFTEKGAETDYFSQVKYRLSQIMQGEIDNQQLIDQLQEMALLQPVALEITFINQQKTRLNGLYTIDKDKMATLSPEQVSKLHQLGLLLPIYTMIASLGQIYSLIDKKNMQLKS
ncbi:peptide ABC transporter permease [Pseudoalteromonas sp. NBT06-2]|uniref:SapC family protein n=1 Tax=Pseudoalteromonas sp. NBT06-2 TaxID=2025950 RepID=UPI000BA6CF4C|nr:SapC family protein [Pseudoalteromonas sp. NBT06-2]PAJ72137.1 peptide ABC transporter permease [Pseudoalteromonas sp. NBT06-2]